MNYFIIEESFRDSRNILAFSSNGSIDENKDMQEIQSHITYFDNTTCIVWNERNVVCMMEEYDTILYEGTDKEEFLSELVKFLIV